VNREKNCKYLAGVVGVAADRHHSRKRAGKRATTTAKAVNELTAT
jgi:hypothetical protein